MIVKISGRQVMEVHQLATQQQLLAECKAAGWKIECPAPASRNGTWSAHMAVAVASAAAVLAAHPAFAAGAKEATASAHPFEDGMIHSVQYVIVGLVGLYVFKRSWWRTAAMASGLVYGAFFCSQAAAMLVAIVFTWLNGRLTDWLETVRLAVS
ncbi:hypothetical protein [Tumebacillus flagellatus]|uniref:Uncharacterized protein n=1 Tax=Tumebacillus flagellatus TaxID=1157490 RepID=A0A074LJL1_9BACL|nr:hypothetical protein [Tumebacillus flagellatus]KEO81289.1 hypothetical protein EL26_21670 [Tumebacillus flagellatus]